MFRRATVLLIRIVDCSFHFYSHVSHPFRNIEDILGISKFKNTKISVPNRYSDSYPKRVSFRISRFHFLFGISYCTSPMICRFAGKFWSKLFDENLSWKTFAAILSVYLVTGTKVHTSVSAHITSQPWLLPLGIFIYLTWL